MSQLVAALSPNLQCMSSGSYVLVAGEIDPSSIDVEGPGALGAEPIVPEETHTTEVPTDHPEVHRIYDLTKPGSAPLETGNAFLNRIIAGDSYIAQVEMTSVRVMTPEGGDVAVRELVSGEGSDYVFEGSDNGLFHFRLDSAGLIEGLDVALVS